MQNAIHAQLAGIPVDLILWFGVILLVTFILSFTTFGRKIYSTGNNAAASYLAGVNVRVVTVILYMLSGLFAALAGIVLVAYGGSADARHGRPVTSSSRSRPP